MWLVLLLSLVVVVVVLLYNLRWRRPSKRVVHVVVLGDVGRSPRMLYHACSLAEYGFKVVLIGFPGSKLPDDVLNNKSICLAHLPPVPSSIKRLPSPLNFIVQVSIQSLILFANLVYHARPTYILVQNPPAIPAMFVSWLVSKLRGSHLVYDWHNYGYSIMALTVNNENHLLVRLYKWYEKLLGRFSHSNICVTDSMKKDLKNNWGIKATTLYDRPPDIFRRLSTQERCHFLEQNSELFGDVGDMMRGAGRHALVVSSTSWTVDEDFSILLDALDSYNKTASELPIDLPPLLCVVTGKGPLKQHYINLIQDKNWSRVRVITPWLKAEDYPQLLGSSDLGICLHTSSSGLDLPMKIVDMFGCDLPVCAYRYRCIGELIEEGVNGLTFGSSGQLAGQLVDLLRNFPENCKMLKKFRHHLKSSRRLGWDENWTKNVSHIFS